MDDRNTSAPKMTVGLDLGDRKSGFCAIDAAGEKIAEGRLATKPEAMRAQFGGMERARIALEVGTHSAWVSDLLKECGHDVIVANPWKVHLISQSVDKDDQTDPERLARLARMDPRLLSPIEHRPAEIRSDLAVIRAREALVGARTKLINHVRGGVKSAGGRIRRCSTEAFANRAAEDVPGEVKGALLPLLGVIARLTGEIRAYDREIEAVARKRYPQTEVVKQPAGVGVLTALAFVLIVGNPRRFRKSRTVGAYVGLTRRRDMSGDQDPELRITKAGDRLLRRLLVGSAQYIMGPFGPDSELRRFGLRLAARGRKNAKKRAVVAVARKLAVLLHHLWVTGEVYEALPKRAVRGGAVELPAREEAREDRG